MHLLIWRLMQKSTKITIFVCILIILVSVGIGIYSCNLLPDKVASHWDASGNVNGYMSKFWGVFLMPIISVVMLVLFLWFPSLDPKKKNIEKFRIYYDIFIIVLMLFMFSIYLVTLLWNFGIKVNMNAFMIVAFFVLMFFIGVLLSKAKPNWFIGIRTPWTLSSEKVWKKTHELGGKLFKICAFVCLAGLFFLNYAIFIILILLLGVVLFLVVYSYILYKKKWIIF